MDPAQPRDGAPQDGDADIGHDATMQADSAELASEPLTVDERPPGRTGDQQPPEKAESRDLTGQLLAERYTVLHEIDRGGMSVIYLGRHELLKKTVVIKVLREEIAGRKDSATRFHREARAAASIGDPHIVDVTDYGFTPSGHAFIVMEYLEGRSLRRTVAEDGPLPAGRAVAIARQILRALRSAHDRGIIHRDLKAENVFLTGRDGGDFVKLLDFGISKMLQPQDAVEATGLTTAGQVLGTPQYLAPEQAHGIENVDHRVDIYALGVMLYEMLTGELPFSGKTALEVVMKHVQEPPQPPRERRPDLAIPVELERVALRALAKDPADRFQSALEMLEALPRSAALDGGYGSDTLQPAPRPRAKVTRTSAVALGLLLVALGGLGTWIALRSRPVAPPATLTDAGPAPDLRLVRSPDARPALDAQRRVEVEIQATPASATISVDGKPVGSGRVVLAVPRDTPLALVVEARGHTPERRTITPRTAMVIPIRLLPARQTRPRPELPPQDLQQNPYKKR